MNTETGRIVRIGGPGGLTETAFRDPFLTPMLIPPTPKQERRGKVGRNDPCPCGSGRKFKRCHLNRKRTI